MRNTLKGLLVVLIIGSFILVPALSYADWNGNNSNHGNWHGNNGNSYSHHHDHSYVGVNLSIWPDSYYYGAPYYPPADEVLVSPPIYQPVVQQPITIIQPPDVTTPSTSNVTSDSITINIPNDKGGYTAVTLKKSANGYIGPQGEFYTEFPKVSQLEIMYGK